MDQSLSSLCAVNLHMSPYIHHHNTYPPNQEEILLSLYTKKTFANIRNNVVTKKNIIHKINTLTERNLIDF